MAELPFLVVHGWWTSKLAVVGCGALGLVVIRALRRRADRKQIALELGARTVALGGLTAGPASVMSAKIVRRARPDLTRAGPRGCIVASGGA